MACPHAIWHAQVLHPCMLKSPLFLFRMRLKHKTAIVLGNCPQAEDFVCPCMDSVVFKWCRQVHATHCASCEVLSPRESKNRRRQSSIRTGNLV
jgi:hypothetical protein